MFHLKEKLSKNNGGFKGIGNILGKNINFADEPWNILKDNVSLPAATLSHSILKHNQSWMNKFAEKFDFQLAPHGKTTMLPELFALQISSGCYGMTLANATQVAAAYKGGVKRVIMANQLVGECNMDIISTILQESPTFDFTCLVDSAENVDQLGKFFKERNQKLQVLIEYGPFGGRTGIRTNLQEETVVQSLAKWKNTISAVGIEFFEGILKEEKDVREFIQKSLSRLPGLIAKNVFPDDEVIITGAGTSWFDVVAEEFLNFEKSCGFQVKKILRSGCYLIYDIGLYKKMEDRVCDMNLSKNDKNCAILKESLKPALKIWAYVQSLPEPNLAIIGMGKRDIAIDCGYPVPHALYRRQENEHEKRQVVHVGATCESWKVFNMMDQHTYMRIDENDDLQIGDIISFDIYHPCTTMDKWRNVLVIDDYYTVIDVYNSDF